MPLSPKESEIMSSMQKSYGNPEKAKRVFYAMATAGKLGGAIQKRHGAQYRSKRKETSWQD